VVGGEIRSKVADTTNDVLKVTVYNKDDGNNFIAYVALD
jgi:hypothetical protein